MKKILFFNILILLFGYANADRYMTVSDPGNTTVINGAAIDGYTGITGNNGGAVVADTDLAVYNTTFSNNILVYPGTWAAALYQQAGNLTINGSTFYNNQATDTAKGYGGAIYSGFTGPGTATVTNTAFNNNFAGRGGGAIYHTNVTGGTAKVFNVGAGVSFYQNSANSMGGAIYNQSILNIADGVTFTGNVAGTLGGAIYQEYEQPGGVPVTTALLTIGNNVKFVGNETIRPFTSATDTGAGGAIYLGNGSASIGDNVVFSANKSAVGGAIANMSPYIPLLLQTGTLTVGANAQFLNNTAANGGAIANAGLIEIGPGAYFSGNSADALGGAVGNIVVPTGLPGLDLEGAIAFMGDVTFQKNKAAGILKDVYNDGIITFADNSTVTFDGGVNGAGTGTLTFGDNVNLVGKVFNNTLSSIANNTITAGAGSKIFYVAVADGAAGSGLKLMDALNGFDDTQIKTNVLYDITSNGDGSFDAAVRDAASIQAASGSTKAQADAVSAIMFGGTSNNAAFNSLKDTLDYMLQTPNDASVAAGMQSAGSLMPSAAPLVQANTLQNNNLVYRTFASRLSGGQYDKIQQEAIYTNGAVWAQGLYNTAKFKGDNGFDATSYGAALGAESYFGENFKAGLGYAFTNTKIEPTDREVTADLNTFMLYGEYKPSAWFVNAALGYTFGSYKENKTILGLAASSNYNVDSWALQMLGGYDIDMDGFTLTPAAGFRYTSISQGDSEDNFAIHVNGNDMSVLSGLLGIKGSKEFMAGRIGLKPEIGFGLSYDLSQSIDDYQVVFPNGQTAKVKTEALDKLGMSLGVGLSAALTKNIDAALGYEGNMRKDYTDHTGLLSFRYKFAYLGAGKEAAAPKAQQIAAQQAAVPARVDQPAKPAAATVLVAQPPAASVQSSLEIGDLFFNAGISDLGPNMRKYLDEKAVEIRAVQYNKVTVYGYADAKEANAASLAQVRAEKVEYYLIYKGINAVNIESVSKGVLPAGATADAAKANRRVEIKVE